MQTLTETQINTIIQLIRRGEQVSYIAAMMHVSRSAVEKILDACVAREMAS